MNLGGGSRSAAIALVLLISLVSACNRPASRAGAKPPGNSDTPSYSYSAAPPSDGSATPPPDTGSEELRTNARIVRVVDGDTVEALFRGQVIDVRLIGIDTPETVHPSEPVECYGPAASKFSKRSLEGRRVRLTFDVEREDRYGRTLAYIWLGDDLFNERLVRQGYATVSTYPPNVRYVDRFLRAQRFARNHDRGLWGTVCAEPAEGSNDGGGGGGNGGACDKASYPGVCIAPYPPDLDCADVPYTDFAVQPPDEHGFDGDGDGVGCES